MGLDFRMASLWVVISLAATHLTFRLTHRSGWEVVRASALPAFGFALVVGGLKLMLARDARSASFQAWLEPLPAIYFGGTFVGMSHPKRLNERWVLAASALFAGLFFALARFSTGWGGQLGATAFAACAIVSLLAPPGSRGRSGPRA